MKVYTSADAAISPLAVAEFARRVEDAGFDGLHLSETVHDPFQLSLLALQATDRLIVRTSVALAFVRSPLAAAYSAWDLSLMSGGRFQLGLGTQIRQNIEDRYGMPWSAPARRMDDYVHILRAAFAAFRTGELSPFEGRHYRLTRLQPYFNPGPDEQTSVPRIYLGAVGPRMLAVAGGGADGLITHPTNSDTAYVAETCLPALETGAAEAGRSLSGFEVVTGLQVITGETADDLAVAREERRRLFAFLYSTPAYRGALERYGFPDLQAELATLVRDGRWDRLIEVVTDEVLDSVVLSARYGDLAETITRALAPLPAGMTAGVTLAMPEDPRHDRAMAGAVMRLQAQRATAQEM